jgi:hypothetical protein
MATDVTKLTTPILEKVLAAHAENGTVIGTHPENGKNVRVCVGRYGSYLMLGEPDDADKITRSLPPALQTDWEVAETLELEQAVGYLDLPRDVADYKGHTIQASIGRYGPYLKWNSRCETVSPRARRSERVGAGGVEGAQAKECPSPAEAGTSEASGSRLAQRRCALLRRKQARSWKQARPARAKKVCPSAADAGSLKGVSFSGGSGCRRNAHRTRPPELARAWLGCPSSPFSPSFPFPFLHSPKSRRSFTSLPAEEDVLTVGEAAAVVLVVDGIENKKTRGAKNVVVDFGEVSLREGPAAAAATTPSF